MKREEYTVIEIFNKKGNNVEDVLKSIFKSYITQKINSHKKKINSQENLKIL